jgi:intein/homing endonuclease
MNEKISIFAFNKNNSKRIYINGINSLLKKIFIKNGGPVKTSKQLSYKYTKTKEWLSGRKPISIFDLKKVLDLLPSKESKEYIQKIENMNFKLSCKYSSAKIHFPKQLDEDLAYLIGILMGDGSLSGSESNKIGNWTISAFFDNLQHQKIFDSILEKKFNIVSSFYDPKGGHTVSYCCSRVIHSFFTDLFGVPNGLKCNKIFIPNKILRSKLNVQFAFVQGLFDSDGTFTNGTAKYSTTSKKMSEDIQKLLKKNNFSFSVNIWVKDKKYLPLFTIAIKSKQSKQLFYELINFRHPNKKLLLKNYINSLVV